MVHKSKGWLGLEILMHGTPTALTVFDAVHAGRGRAEERNIMMYEVLTWA